VFFLFDYGYWALCFFELVDYLFRFALNDLGVLIDIRRLH